MGWKGASNTATPKSQLYRQLPPDVHNGPECIIQRMCCGDHQSGRRGYPQGRQQSILHHRQLYRLVPWWFGGRAVLCRVRGARPPVWNRVMGYRLRTTWYAICQYFSPAFYQVDSFCAPIVENMTFYLLKGLLFISRLNMKVAAEWLQGNGWIFCMFWNF